MKNTMILGIVVALIIGFTGGFAIARSRYQPLFVRQSREIIAKDALLDSLKKEAVLPTPMVQQETVYGLQNGKLVVNINGTVQAATQAVMLVNKTKILPDGTVQRVDGTRFKLVEGEWLSVQ